MEIIFAITAIMAAIFIAAAFFYIGKIKGVKADPQAQNKIFAYDSLLAEKERLQKEKDEISDKLMNIMPLAGRVQELEANKLSLENKISSLEAANRERQKLLAELNARKAELDERQANLEKENARLADEKNSLLQTYKAEFEALAGKILASQTSIFKETNKSEINHIITPLNLALADFRKKIEEHRQAQTADSANLSHQLNTVIEAKTNLENITKDFVNALRGESSVRGAWGEDTLRRLLEDSGLRRDVNYFEQYNEDEGKRPDFIVLLPNNKMIVIDAKTVFNNYAGYIDEVDPVRKKEYLAAHISDVKKTVKALGTAKYKTSAQKICKKLGIAETTEPVEYVLMWVNPEAAITCAVSEDGGILKEAHENKVILVSGSSLINALKMIDSLWTNYIAQEKGEEIKELAEELVYRFGNFLACFLEVKNHLNKALSAHEDAVRIVGENEKSGMLLKAQELANIYESKISKADSKTIKRMGYSYDGKKKSSKPAPALESGGNGSSLAGKR